MKARIIKSSVSADVFYQSELPDFKQNFGKNGWSKTTLSCPFTKHENKGGFSINKESGGYNCFKCGVSGGDIIDFYMKLNNVDFIKACNDIAKGFNITFPQEKAIIKKYQVDDVISKATSMQFVNLYFPFCCCFLKDESTLLSQQDVEFVKNTRIKVFNLLTSIYGKPRGKRFSKKYFKRSFFIIFGMHKKRVFQENNFIFDEMELKMGKYLAYCLRLLK